MAQPALPGVSDEAEQDQDTRQRRRIQQHRLPYADAPVPRHVRQPCLVDLHGADVHGGVGVAADPAEATALDVEQDHQHGGRQALRLRRGQDAVLDHLAGGAGLLDPDADGSALRLGDVWLCQGSRHPAQD